MLASVDVPAAESGTIPPARAMERSSACGLQRHSIGAGCEHDRRQQRSGCRARFRFERYLAGGRSGLSAHFRAAGSRTGSSSQARQTLRGRPGATSSGTAVIGFPHFGHSFRLR